MTKKNSVYQVKVGDGVKKKSLSRKNSYFNTPQEAISEALAFKEKMDSEYSNEIEWDYKKGITGSSQKMKILSGYLGGDKNTKPFYLQILTVALKKDFSLVQPFKPKKISVKDKKVLNNVSKALA